MLQQFCSNSMTVGNAWQRIKSDAFKGRPKQEPVLRALLLRGPVQGAWVSCPAA